MYIADNYGKHSLYQTSQSLICAQVARALSLAMNKLYLLPEAVVSKFLERVTGKSLYRIDTNGVIKVADFGLSEATTTKDYFRQDKDNSVKLPIKWMAPESIGDGIFSEKSDVVSTYV